FLFFVQAEDGIRDFHVTGLQTCALPIFPGTGPIPAAGPETAADGAAIHIDTGRLDRITDELAVLHGELQAAARIRDDYDVRVARSEERRVGTEGTTRRYTDKDLSSTQMQ